MKNELSRNQNKNVRYYSKNSKFGINKYNEGNKDNFLLSEIFINSKYNKTNITYNNNCCITNNLSVI